MEILFVIFFTLIGLVLLLKYSKKSIPYVVSNSFSELYPNSINIDWTIFEGGFEVIFFLNNQQKKARFDKNGIWLETKNEILIAELPNELKNVVTKQFPVSVINEASYYELPSQNNYYKVILATKQQDNYLLKFDNNFNLIQNRNLTDSKGIERSIT